MFMCVRVCACVYNAVSHVLGEHHFTHHKDKHVPTHIIYTANMHVNNISPQSRLLELFVCV